VPGDASEIGYDGARPRHDHHEFGRGLGRNQDGPIRKIPEVFLGAKVKGSAAPDARVGRLAAVQQERVFLRIGSWDLAGLGFQAGAERAGLEQEEVALPVKRPLDVLRRPVMLFKPEGVCGQCLYPLVTKACKFLFALFNFLLEKSALGVADQLYRLPGNVLPQNITARRPAYRVLIRGDEPVHRVRGQAQTPK